MSETRPGKDAAVAALKEMAQDAREGKLEIPGHNGEPHIVSTPEEAQAVLKGEPALVVGVDMGEEGGDTTAVEVVDTRSGSGEKVVKISRQKQRKEDQEQEKKQEALRKLMNRPATMGALAQMGDDVKRNFGNLSNQSNVAIKIGQDCWRAIDIIRELLVEKGLVTDEELTGFFNAGWDKRVANERAEQARHVEGQRAMAQASEAMKQAAIDLSMLKAKRNPLATPEEIKEAEEQLEKLKGEFEATLAKHQPPLPPPPAPEEPEPPEPPEVTEGERWE